VFPSVVKAGMGERADVAKVHHDMRETPFQADRTVALLGKGCGIGLCLCAGSSLSPSGRRTKTVSSAWWEDA
jgi:hypothetical protein